MGYAAASQPQAACRGFFEDFGQAIVPSRRSAKALVRPVTAIGLHAFSAENFRNSGAAKTSVRSLARSDWPTLYGGELAKAEVDGQDCAMRKQDCAMRKIVRR